MIDDVNVEECIQYAYSHHVGAYEIIYNYCHLTKKCCGSKENYNCEFKQNYRKNKNHKEMKSKSEIEQKLKEAIEVQLEYKASNKERCYSTGVVAGYIKALQYVLNDSEQATLIRLSEIHGVYR